MKVRELIPGIADLKTALYAWLFSLLVTVILIHGLFTIATSIAGETVLVFEKFRYGIMTFLTDLLNNYPGSSPLILILAVVVMLLMLLLSIFISGGIYAVLLERGPITLRRLFSASAKNFGSMFKMFLVNILNWIAAALIPALFYYVHQKIQSSSPSESLWKIFLVFWVPIAVIFLWYAVAVYDFSRMYILKERGKAFRILWSGVRFFFSHKLSILILFVLYAISLLVIFILYRVIVPALAYAVLLFIFYQLVLFGRCLIKVILMRLEVGLLTDVG